jgi:hypothetical protein
MITKFLPAASLALALLGLCQPLRAQNAAAESHPAVKVVREYNSAILNEGWEKASVLIEPASLASLRDDYVDRAKRPGVLSLDDEKLLLGKFAVKDLDAIKKVDPKKFYVGYHQLIKTDKSAPEEVIKRVRETMKLTVLGVVEEKEQNKVHVILRSKHENGRALIDNLELVSLINEGGKWLVGLNEQTAKVTPLGKNAASKAPAGAAP